MLTTNYCSHVIKIILEREEQQRAECKSQQIINKNGIQKISSISLSKNKVEFK